MNDEETLQFEVGQRSLHRWCDGWGRGVFNFESPPFSAPNDEQVEFGPAMSGPEETLVFVDPQMSNNLVDDKTLP